MIRRLAVIGVGLLGGSVAKAARAQGAAREVVGIGRDLTRLRAAVTDGALDHATTDLAEGLRGADFVVLGAPVRAIEDLLERMWAALPADAVVTDVGSSKAAIVRKAEALARRLPRTFVGSHPMAGSEKSGYGVARADLFTGALVVVTPTDATDTRAVKTVTGFWEHLGARVTTLDPEAHDAAVAAISHLPHLVACALVDAVAGDAPGALPIAARGFKDTTRIAAGDPVMWQEIFLANREPLRVMLGAFRRALDTLEREIAAGDPAVVEASLLRIKQARERLT
ncbi:MAG TPA: prephenate dehydrogenase/arogenate dehydrogenase family protein [Terriglobales bacterium]|nr:prephenate dehydrogenase/arogenate dehydrogenase family protein [Terriglobales bacterium]